ncbi:hypothetical protein E4K72_01145 [Oxalobacteraceae bacterium OM1]|nr:hypothetical protein E4K72_01145 [Oxalobacteraceae bacterium OM1]
MNGNQDCFLFPHEWDALKNALRRDISTELEKAGADAALANPHARNARMSQRILETLFADAAAAVE